VGAGLLASARAAADVNRRLAAVAEYAAKNNLPVRTLKINLPGRQVERQVVPILPGTMDDFRDRFEEKQGCITWRQPRGNAQVPGLATGWYDIEHCIISFGRKQQVTFYQKGVGDLEPGMDHQWGGYCTVLEPPDVGFLQGFWTKYHPNNQAGFQQDGRKIDGGGCMWWLVHAEADANRTPLSHALGVNRSRAPSNLFKKLVHAGNDRVGPVGVCVKTLEEFNAMSDVQLLGPAPGGGAAEAVK
jgi:hypothetical protein